MSDRVLTIKQFRRSWRHAERLGLCDGVDGAEYRRVLRAQIRAGYVVGEALAGFAAPAPITHEEIERAYQEARARRERATAPQQPPYRTLIVSAV